jgi:outer membrane protein
MQCAFNSCAKCAFNSCAKCAFNFCASGCRVSALLIAVCGSAFAQMTITQAVGKATQNYPSIRVSVEQSGAAAEGIKLARTAFLPRVDFLAQINRASRNNVMGLLLPQSTLPSISGPVLGTNGLTNVWGSAVGGLVSWEPFDFGLRKANVESAEASRNRAQAAVARNRFEAGAAAADAFLTLLAAEQVVAVAKASGERASTIQTMVGALVRSELRPGADLSRADAEAAMATTQLIQAEQAVALAKVGLSQWVGVPAAQLAVDRGPLLNAPPSMDVALSGVANHPAATEQTLAIDEVRAREKALDKSYYPKFNSQAALYARGTGANPDGTTGGAFSGFGPNYQNWALGLTVTFPVMDIYSLRVRKQIEQQHEKTESARYDQILLELNTRVEAARASLDGARRVLTSLPPQIKAARDSVAQASARYKAGLGTIAETAEAQRILAQSEIDESLAKLNIWRAMLAVAAAQGDLDPFLKNTK